MAQAKQDTKPNKDFTTITQTGLTAYHLTVQYAPQLTGRLDVTLVPILAADLDSLGVVIPAVLGARGDAKQSTVAQNDSLSTGYDYVTAVRLAVGRKQPAASVKKAYGVGDKTNKLVVKDVLSSLQKIVDRATAQPAEAQSFAMTPGDVKTYEAQIQKIKDADKAQEISRASAPLSTKQRNIVLRRILSAVDSISGAGVLAFATSPTERASFEGLVKKAK